MREKTWSIPGIILIIIGFIFFTYCSYEIFKTMIIAFPFGLIVTIAACRPAVEDGCAMWEKYEDKK